MNVPTTMTIPDFHSLYCELTGMPVRFDMGRENTWQEWLRWKHTADDLRMVVAYLKREIKLGKRNPGALKFSRLIGYPDYFDEDKLLALAFDRITQKQARRPVASPAKAAVLRATGRETERPRRDPDAVAAIVAQCLEKMRRDTL